MVLLSSKVLFACVHVSALLVGSSFLPASLAKDMDAATLHQHEEALRAIVGNPKTSAAAALSGGNLNRSLVEGDLTSDTKHMDSIAADVNASTVSILKSKASTRGSGSDAMEDRMLEGYVDPDQHSANDHPTNPGNAYFRSISEITDASLYETGLSVAGSDDLNIIAIANYKGTQEEGPYFPVVTLFTLDVVNNVCSPAGTIEDNTVVQAIFAKDAQVEVEVSGDGSKVAIAQVYTNRRDDKKQYFSGEIKDDSCPAGTVKVDTEADCFSAAAVADGFISSEGTSNSCIRDNSLRPSGCYSNVIKGEEVCFNQATSVDEDSFPDQFRSVCKVPDSNVKIYQKPSGTLDADSEWTLDSTPHISTAGGGGYHPGMKLSLNVNGSLLLIGERYASSGSGKVTLYDLSTETVLKTIPGAGDDKAGSSVMLSRDGTCFIYGATGKYSSKGEAYVYCLDDDTDTWELKHTLNSASSTDAEQDFGFSVAINSNANYVAVGARYHDYDSKVNNGVVMVFNISGASATQVGNTISGERGESDPSSNLYYVGDEFGFSLALSDTLPDGTIRVAIGGPKNDNSATGYYNGHVELHEISASASSSVTWTAIGYDLDGSTDREKAGFSLAFSKDGNILAVGSPGFGVSGGVGKGAVRVYEQLEYSSSPSLAPSSSPSDSSQPSQSPSVSTIPSTVPSTSQAPSFLPSVSMEPSISPSTSAQPSQSPSVSMVPSTVPSTSQAPSSLPSVSMEPSNSPSTSAQPSQSPSVSMVPSTVPSTSQAPSSLPSKSMEPSNSPSTSTQPSMVPSSAPSISQVPSSSPSLSSVPSTAPSITSQPSLNPSALSDTEFLIKSTFEKFDPSRELGWCLTASNKDAEAKLNVRPCKPYETRAENLQLWTIGPNNEIMLAGTSSQNLLCIKSTFRQLKLEACSQDTGGDISQTNFSLGSNFISQTRNGKTFYFGFDPESRFERVRLYREGALNEVLNKWMVVYRRDIPDAHLLFTSAPSVSLVPSSSPSQDPYLLGDENSVITFDNVDFGSTNSIKGIKVTYSNNKRSGYGSVEIKLGDASGTILAQFSPSGTEASTNTMLIPFDNTVQLSDVNSLTFVTSETTAVMHLISYELIDLSERFTPFTTISATEVSDQSGVGGITDIGYFNNGNYFTYSPIDFGLGTSSIKITYSKNKTGGRLEIRKGDVNGEVIGNYYPASTGGWANYQTVDIPIKTTSGINELTFIARTSGDRHYLLNLLSFQLSPVSAGYICLDSTARTQPESVQAATSAQTGADLVSIRCSAQQNAVASLPITTGTWIGGTDAANEGTWVLPDGNALTYSNWNADEPNDLGNEDCIVIGTDGLWYDFSCEENQGHSMAGQGSVVESTFEIDGLTCSEYVECQDTVKIVENGIQTSDYRLRNSNLVTQTDTAGAYLSVPGSSTATDDDNWNVYNLAIGANDDFVMLAKLKVDGSGSAASFFINDLDNFGFDGNSNQIFTHSNPEYFSTFYDGSFVEVNKGTHSDNLFYFKVERKLGTIKFYINDEEVASTANYNVAISKFFWRPWRANLKIYDWTVSGPSLLDFDDIVFDGVQLNGYGTDQCIGYDQYKDLYMFSCTDGVEQQFTLTSNGLIVWGGLEDMCLLADEGFWPKLRACDSSNQNQIWTYENGQFKTGGGTKCLTLLNDTNRLVAPDCTSVTSTWYD